MQRKIIINPHQLGNLDGFNIGLMAINPMLCNCADRLFFSQMIQSGVDSFEIINVPKASILNSSYLKNKITIIDGYDYDELLSKVHRVFETFFGEYSKNKNVDREIIKMEYYLTGLLYAASKKSDFVDITRKPDMEKIKSISPPEFFYPVNSLIQSIKEENIDLPLPMYSLESKELNKFMDIIESDLYKNYCNIYSDVSNLTKDTRIVLDKIEKKGKELKLSNNSILRTKKIQLNFLDRLTDFCAIINKKEWGILIKFITVIAEELDYKRNRIVIYNFSDTVSNVIKNEVEKISTN